MTAATAPTAFSIAIPAPIQNRALLNLLVVDDERSVRDACREAASALGCHASVAESAEQALRWSETQSIDVAFVDLQMNGAGGLDLLRQLKARRPEIEVILMAAHGTVESAVEAMKAGAYDFVSKPFTLQQLSMALDRVSAHLRLKTANRILREKIKSKQGFGNIIGRAPEMDKLYRIIAKAQRASGADPWGKRYGQGTGSARDSLFGTVP
jgi:two-component system response regulator AtoC